MNKVENNRILINNIREERKELLNKVRESITSGSENVINNADSIISMLDYDEKNIKKYESLKQAQELIESLMNEIAAATSKEDIESLRKKLNYYINKIKNEAKKREIDYSIYYESVTNIRHNISKCLRLIKRENQLDQLDEINDNYDNLDKEEKTNLSRKISYEKSYNNKFTKNMESNKLKTQDKIGINNDLKGIINKDSKKFNFDTNLLKFNKQSAVSSIESYSSDEDFITSKVDSFDERYKLVKTNPYNGNIIHNMTSLLKNIPIYKTNKKRLKIIRFDYSCFYRKDELKAYIRYNEKNNSIKEGIKSIFGKSSLYSKETKYLDNHERCIEWILSYIRRHHLKLNYNQAK